MDDRTKTDPTKGWPDAKPGQTPFERPPRPRWGRRLGVLVVLLLVAGLAWWVYQRQQLDTQAALVLQYQGNVMTDQAQIDTAKLNIAYCHIVAPVSGRLGLRQVDQGNYVTAGDAAGLVVITQLTPISVLFTTAED